MVLQRQLGKGTDYKNIDFFKFVYFNWRLIALQYFSGFCHTLT